jgi:hypothetical protein
VSNLQLYATIRGNKNGTENYSALFHLNRPPAEDELLMAGDNWVICFHLNRPSADG